jgi:hypothetical protein
MNGETASFSDAIPFHSSNDYLPQTIQTHLDRDNRKIVLNLRKAVDGEKEDKQEIASQKLGELTERFQHMNKKNETLKSVL